jgi:hypothetical protein
MSERTIPTPHQDLISSAKSGIMFRAEQNKVILQSEDQLRFVDQVAANIAQLKAEILWLRNMIHEIDIPEKENDH